MSTQHFEPLDPQADEQYRSFWYWFLASGLALVTLGGLTFAHLVFSSIISTFIIGTIIMMGGMIGVAHAIGIRRPDEHHFWIYSSFLYSVAGIAILIEPIVGDRVLTLLLAVGVGLSGLSRVVVGAQLKSNAVLISGTTSLMAATAIGVGWAQTELWVIASCITIDLLVQGMMLIVTGMTLHLPGRSNG